MRERTDPLVPLLGLAVIALFVGVTGFIFYPRIASWLGPPRESVVGAPLSPTETVPVWVCSSVEGVALMLEGGLDGGLLDEALDGGPYHYLRLSVYNFAGPESYEVELPEAGLGSPEGGAAALAAARLVRKDAPEHLRAVLGGLGAVTGLKVAKARSGHALLVVPADPKGRTAFVNGALRFERRELERRVLASWRQRPDFDKFKDF